MTGASPLLEIDRLVIGGADGTVPIVDDLSLTIDRAASLGIAGESGCGKSTLLLAMMGIIKPGLRRRAGGCRFDGMDLLNSDDRALEKLRGGRVSTPAREGRPSRCHWRQSPSSTATASCPSQRSIHQSRPA